MASDYSSEDFFADLMQTDPANGFCFDCKEANPAWASVNHGILICASCTSLHRALGSQVSLVRSISLDMWTEKHYEMMKAGGNAKMNAFFERYSLNTDDVNTKYMSRAA